MTTIEERVTALEHDNLQDRRRQAQIATAVFTTVSSHNVRFDSVDHQLAQLRETQLAHGLRLARMETDVAGLKTDVATLKTDVATLKTDVEGMKGQLDEVVAGIRTLHRLYLGVPDSNTPAEPDEVSSPAIG